MSHPSPKQQGFSTVELLISLFIAAAFIGAGFQLFSVVTNDSNKARLRAAATGIVNAKIQERMSNARNPCGPPEVPATIPIASSELPKASATVTYICPYGASSKTTRVKVVVTYGTPQEAVEGSLDVTQ